MINNYKKQIILTLFLIFILFCVVFCFVFLLKDSPIEKNNTSALSVEFLNEIDSVNIENVLPINDIVGKKLDGKGTKEGTQGYLEFTLKSNSSNNVGYKIIVDSDNKSKEKIIKDKYIKFLSSGNIKYPLELLNDLGIDITDEMVLSRAFELFNEKLELLKNMGSGE